jgi:hypothetical protein
VPADHSIIVANHVKGKCHVCNAMDAKEVMNVDSYVKAQALNARKAGFAKRVEC